MKRPSFSNGILAGVILSFLGTLTYAALPFIVSLAVSSCLTITAIAITYCAYLSFGGKTKTGWLTATSVMSLLLFVALVLSLSIFSFLSINLLVIWILRCARFYRSVFSMLLDFGLLGLGAIAGVLTYNHTHSVFLGIWVFFLIQALCAFIPNTFEKLAKAATYKVNHFETAFDDAEKALKRIKQS